MNNKTESNDMAKTYPAKQMQRVGELHNEALSIFARMERIIDELKSIEPREKLNALPNIEDWLGQLSGRAHVQGSRVRYVYEPAND